MATRAAQGRTGRNPAKRTAQRHTGGGAKRSAAAPARRSRALAFAFVAVCVAIMVGLGVWQLQRKAWKEHILARIAALQSAPAEPLNVVLNRIGDGGSVDYVRVQTRCPTLGATPFLRLYAVNEAGAGFRLITACPLEGAAEGAGYRSILVDRGFIAQDAVGKVVRSSGAVEGPVTGVLRIGDKPGPFTPPHTTPGADWYGRDPAAMAAALHAPKPAPVFLMLERPAPRAFGPTPAPVPVDIPNRHLEYAITWFGLAAALVCVYVASLARRPARG